MMNSLASKTSFPRMKWHKNGTSVNSVHFQFGDDDDDGDSDDENDDDVDICIEDQFHHLWMACGSNLVKSYWSSKAHAWL